MNSFAKDKLALSFFVKSICLSTPLAWLSSHATKTAADPRIKKIRIAPYESYYVTLFFDFPLKKVKQTKKI